MAKRKRSPIERSRFRAGGIDAQGVPAVLCGIAAVVAAYGVGAALTKAAVAFPEAIRETRLLLTAVRGRPELMPGG